VATGGLAVGGRGVAGRGVGVAVFAGVAVAVGSGVSVGMGVMDGRGVRVRVGVGATWARNMSVAWQAKVPIESTATSTKNIFNFRKYMKSKSPSKSKPRGGQQNYSTLISFAQFFREQKSGASR